MVFFRKVLLGWHHTVREEVDHKEGLADHMHRYLLTRRSFTNWRRVRQHGEQWEEKSKIMGFHNVYKLFTIFETFFSMSKDLGKSLVK